MEEQREEKQEDRGNEKVTERETRSEMEPGAVPNNRGKTGQWR